MRTGAGRSLALLLVHFLLLLLGCRTLRRDRREERKAGKKEKKREKGEGNEKDDRDRDGWERRKRID